MKNITPSSSCNMVKLSRIFILLGLFIFLGSGIDGHAYFYMHLYPFTWIFYIKQVVVSLKNNFSIASLFAWSLMSIWAFLAFYIPIEVAILVKNKLRSKNRSMVYLSFSLGIVFVFSCLFTQLAFGLLLPVMKSMSILAHYKPEWLDTIAHWILDYGRIHLKIIGICFIILGMRLSIRENNITPKIYFKNFFTREFWNLKIITRACCRFIVLSIVSGLITYGTFFTIYYISKLF